METRIACSGCDHPLMIGTETNFVCTCGGRYIVKGVDNKVASGEEINKAGVDWLSDNPSYGVPYSMTEGYWNSLTSMLAQWGFRVVIK